MKRRKSTTTTLANRPVPTPTAVNQTNGVSAAPGKPPRNCVDLYRLRGLARSGYTPRQGEPISEQFIDNTRTSLKKEVNKLSRPQLRAALHSLLVETAYDARYAEVENERRAELRTKFTELQAAVGILAKINAAL